MTADPREPAPDPPWPIRLAQGLILGQLVAATAMPLRLGLPGRAFEDTWQVWPPLVALLMLGPRWARRLLWVGCGALAALSALVALTPFAVWAQRQLTVDEGPAKADVIVVLSASTNELTMSSNSQDRWLAGLRLLHAGWAPRIVFTGEPGRAANQFTRMASDQMTALGLSTAAVVPFAPEPGQTLFSTRGEALATAAMARAHGWRRILVVTSPAHTYRTQRTFRRVGLDARIVAAESSLSDARGTRVGSERIQVLAFVVYELGGLLKYRLKGWI